MNPNEYVKFMVNLENEAKEAIPVLTKIAGQGSAYRDNLETAHPGWNTNLDARLTAFGKIVNPLNAATLSYCALKEYFLNTGKDSFFKRESIEGITFSPNETVVHLLSYRQSNLFGLFYQVFSGIESSLRIFLREQTVRFGQKAVGSFFEEFQTLFDVCEISNSKTKEYKNLLEILITYRNCIHNNGVYMHEQGGRYTIEYNKGGIEEFVFEQGKAVKIDWNKIEILFLHALEMLNELVQNEVISSVGKMEDPLKPELFGLSGSNQ